MAVLPSYRQQSNDLHSKSIGQLNGLTPVFLKEKMLQLAIKKIEKRIHFKSSYRSQAYNTQKSSIPRLQAPSIFLVSKFYYREETSSSTWKPDLSKFWWAMSDHVLILISP